MTPKDEKGQTFQEAVARSGESEGTDETVTQHLGGSTSLQEGPNAPAGDWDEMARELLPCPFCGGAAQFQDTSEVTNEGGIVVECQKCRACTAVVFCAKDDPKPYALYLWNSRDAAAPELYTTLEEMRNVLAECAYDTLGTPTHDFFQSKVRTCDVVLAKARGKA